MSVGFYERCVLPWLIDLAMRNATAREARARWVPLAAGRVLEVGIGSGLNLGFYSRAVLSLTGLDTSGPLLARARRRAARAPFPVELIEHSAERIPVEDRSFDSVVTTWTLCSIADPLVAVAEMRRVLRPDGRLIFVEHGQAPDARVRAWQDRLTPLWRRLAGGCHLNRRIDALIVDAGFRLDSLEATYRRGPRVMTHFYEGIARPTPAVS